DDDQKARLALVVKALSAEAQLPAQRELDAREEADIVAGREELRSEDLRCTECHEFHQPDDSATGPMLTGYGSRDWLVRFIHDPAHEKFYGRRNDRMPSYGETGSISDDEIGLIADW